MLEIFLLPTFNVGKKRKSTLIIVKRTSAINKNQHFQFLKK